MENSLLQKIMIIYQVLKNLFHMWHYYKKVNFLEITNAFWILKNV